MNDIRDHQDEREFAEEGTALWRITLPPTVWALHFVFCYAGAAVWCAKFGHAQGVTVARWSILGLTLLALGVIVWLGWLSVRRWRPDGAEEAAALGEPESRHRFLGHAAFLLSLISAIGVVYVALPALFMGTCR